MNPDQSSISIINKNNGQITGESTNALPIRVMSNLSWLQYILIGVGLTLLFSLYFIYSIQDTVVVVEVSGRSQDFQVYEIQ